MHWSTCNSVRHALRFFFRITLARPDPHFFVPGAKHPSRLPQLLNHEELVRLFTVTTNLKHRSVLMTAYAAGLRASELGRLQLSDIDSARMCLRVEQGKGAQSRSTSTYGTRATVTMRRRRARAWARTTRSPSVPCETPASATSSPSNASWPECATSSGASRARWIPTTEGLFLGWAGPARRVRCP